MPGKGELPGLQEMSFSGKQEGPGCRDLKIRRDKGGGWGLQGQVASGKFLMLRCVKDVKDEDNIQMESWSIIVLVQCKTAWLTQISHGL